MAIVYLVQMEGPEWTEVLGVFVHTTLGGVRPRARADKLVKELQERNATALKRVPKTYRTDTFLSLSRFVVVVKAAE